MHVTRTLTTCCPFCSATIDAATSVGESATPAADDLTMCAACGEFSVFTSDLDLAKPSAEVAREIEHNADCQTVKQAWYQYERERKRSVH